MNAPNSTAEERTASAEGCAHYLSQARGEGALNKADAGALEKRCRAASTDRRRRIYSLTLNLLCEYHDALISYCGGGGVVVLCCVLWCFGRSAHECHAYAEITIQSTRRFFLLAVCVYICKYSFYEVE